MASTFLDSTYGIGVKCHGQIYIKSGCMECNANYAYIFDGCYHIWHNLCLRFVDGKYVFGFHVWHWSQMSWSNIHKIRLYGV